MIVVQEVPFASPLYALTKIFRDGVLRRPLGLVLSADDLQDEDQQIHIAAVHSSTEIVGTVVLKPISSDTIKLRQMAVAPTSRHSGIGRNLVRFAERLVLAKGFEIVEMHARMSAKGFYEKLGYQSIGVEFMEVTVPTIKMIRQIHLA